MLILSRKSGEAIKINEDIEIKILDITGDKIRMGIDAPSNVRILRSELVLTAENNREAADSPKNSNITDSLASLISND